MKLRFSFSIFRRGKQPTLAEQDAAVQAKRAARQENLEPLTLDHELTPVEAAPVLHVEPDGLGIVARTPGFGDKKETP